MPVAETSRQAYQTVKLNKNESIVHTVITLHQPVTNDEIARILGWPIQSVTGRTNALVTKNMVRVLDKNGVSDSGRKAQRYVTHTPGDDKLVKAFKSIDDDTDKYGHSFGVANG